MPVLSSSHRGKLEKAVVKARKLSESGADNALEALAVHENEPYSHLDPDQRKLRNVLRAKGRLLGDVLKNDGKQSIYHLSYELAYEYWHKMLFAAFLESNGLLMHPSGVAVSFEEVEELAPEEGYPNKWVAAAHYASEMLPAIFRVDDPLMQVEFSLNDRIALETLLDELDNQIFEADDALGWVYQYWQSEAKARINESGDKIDGEKLPAVTQLFTEHYMVQFLIDNTIGAWWKNRNPVKTAPVEFEYLRTLDDGTPAAGGYEGWPDSVDELTCMDPCMGSGHFITSLFQVLAPLRMEEESLSKEEATDAVITDNLHGLELDPRCTQLGAFNLALTAWKFCGKYRELPEMNLACSGIAPKGKEEDWVNLVGDVARDDQTRMENGMRELYRHFQMAPELGSLLDPSTIKADAFTASFEELQPVLNEALEKEENYETKERGVVAEGIAKAGKLLSNNYNLVITNVPYLGKGKLGRFLSDHLEENFEKSKSDLATVFIEKFLMKCSKLAVVSPQNWAFQYSYKSFRKFVADNHSIISFIKLGENAFDSPQAAGAFAGLFIIDTDNSKRKYFGLDLTRFNKPTLKKENLIKNEIILTNKTSISKKLDYRFIFGETSKLKPLSDFATSIEGLSTGDKNRYVFSFWEMNLLHEDWELFQVSPNSNQDFTGLNCIIRWENNSGSLSKSDSARVQGFDAWGKKGILVNLMRNLNASIYIGEIHDKITAAIIPLEKVYIEAVWCYVKSDEFYNEVRNLNPALQPGTSTLVKVPFDLKFWKEIAEEKYPNGLPDPYSDDPTQWIHHGHPKQTDKPLQVALARMLGYRWPAEHDEEMELANEARELINEIEAFDNLSDEDGIVCIPSVNAEQAAASRLRDYLKEVWGNEWNNQTIETLLEKEEAKAKNLESWLRDKFFDQHCKLFNNRPFIWHIWDGHKQGFSALVNYHKLTRDNLQKLIYTYLEDWIRQCEVRLKNGQSGAEGQIAAAKKLKEKLLLILEGEPPYDIFVRWKPLEEQPIGWDPDLNDGVLLNLYPFVEAGVLRKKFNVKWTKDRGKNPEGAPWGPLRYNRYEDLDDEYKLSDERGEVIPHLTNDVKRKARKESKE